jgi:hypothetical protein
MPAVTNPQAKTAQVVLHPRNDYEVDLLKKLKRIISGDGETTIQFFLPFIEKIVKERAPSNPQTLMDPSSPRGRTLSRNQRSFLKEKQHYIEEPCPECSGVGVNAWGGHCRYCNGVGKVGVEN